MDYKTWKEKFEQARDVRSFFASDRKAAQAFFPVYVQDQIKSSPLRDVNVSTPDYHVLISDVNWMNRPRLVLSSRRYNLMPEDFFCLDMDALAKYAAMRIGRTGAERFLLDVVPETICAGISRTVDFLEGLYHPIDSRNK